MRNYSDLKIGDIVTQDFRAAEIFKNAGIDFCCGGYQLLGETCKSKNLDLANLEEQLSTLEYTKVNDMHNFKEWNLDFLSDYIVNTHHKTVLRLLPQLTAYTEKIAAVHGDNHPELIEIADLFAAINTELLQHLKNEEEVLFPAIKELLKNLKIKIFILFFTYIS